MDHVRRLLDGAVLPTPGAVLEAAELLHAVVGDVMVVDVGGATTDVHSVTAGSPELSARAVEPEPLAKRTVEGDLGVWVSAETLLAAEGLAEGLAGDEADALAPLPVTDTERQLTQRLARRAAVTAVDRHAGKLLAFFGPRGREERPEGRDLSVVRAVVGTGGALTQLGGGKEALASCLAMGPLHPPSDAEVILDRLYLLSSLGVISIESPDDARSLALRYFGDQKRTRDSTGEGARV